ncbi:1-(5-phosphoribosyl)-5-[(5-phosphoribosylamino)methylideneamino]imidazole-4-carboxamide isomerase [Helicobacter saguini]|uniref:1-(5-phosphoribosyl)-5-[(5-phosphoribosylamino)methylideneamino] imidazole-4-carboxamide isomerase n=1 Tax=Helicobacter saguini TaxID=1548018 RepID=A0A347VMX3_9HELI|nr:1-(5-phosphoribosyl)-5-[(5-phosphoribosylamino)methylideneamino]imidazole-4-carboxamide isomerase [Helicobacter saguini]MWV61989.1 1-(5-phosphoribosyl)-5-[(5-phosphoribosylamino)methylideneamino]imidazole-4-carboxamide isomerase [Helicobacter saguini]MWV67337.1 1-(5-phosphoribosyl)-5-[(5-phosphoribosylamino)methylideneamino]imidazole-4-carboxamide isomerase [Helicobacter saguini]MWV69688.1 1-(5-phosphoribosyl)-5-[(5-phosphoribosylamino)methylideneamino]imidazole-4-carboxamide isomerase [Helic
MEKFLAIDLLDSKAVRLTKGEKESAKVYGDALDFAKYFESCGAKWLHIVDLNGAFDGSPKNLDTIESIRNVTKLHVQVGGGIRDENTIKKYINIGVNRVILGSIAIKNPQFCKEMAKIYPLAISIDSKDGKVATHGWVNVSEIAADSFAESFKDSEIEAIICTDINKDGLLGGINWELTQEIATKSNKFTIASGGFNGLSDLQKGEKYSKIGGVIIGRAFYENAIDLKKVNF